TPGRVARGRSHDARPRRGCSAGERSRHRSASIDSRNARGLAADTPRRTLMDRRRTGGPSSDDAWATSRRTPSARTIGDAPAGRVVRRDRYGHAVAQDHADPVAPHLASKFGDDVVAFAHVDLEGSACEDLDDFALEFNRVVAAHSCG